MGPHTNGKIVDGMRGFQNLVQKGCQLTEEKGGMSVAWREEVGQRQDLGSFKDKHGVGERRVCGTQKWRKAGGGGGRGRKM